MYICRLGLRLALIIIFIVTNISNIFPGDTSKSDHIEFEKFREEIEEKLEKLVNYYNQLTYLAEHARCRSETALEKADKAIEELDATSQKRRDFIQERELQNRAKNIEYEKILIQEKIKEKVRQGVYGIIEQEKWKSIQGILSNPKSFINIISAMTSSFLFYYLIKHGVPYLIDYFVQPKVIIETSKKGWFCWEKQEQSTNTNELIFEPELQKQLADLISQIQTAKQYNENLPNLLFFGPPGTGKTTFARVLAKKSGLDYALTSGSEFAKITDLNIANNELRKLLKWAKNSNNGLIIFIDEAESLFASKKLSTTTKIMQDFINTFLSLVQDQSQKNLMFIFATNHPLKIDNSILNRIGINIKFALPKKNEREKILIQYIVKFAQENNDAIVSIDPKIRKHLSEYAKSLEGFSPRAIKFIAENMVIKARRKEDRLLTSDIAWFTISQIKQNLQQKLSQEKDCKNGLIHCTTINNSFI